jgi:hypothetical protein
MTRDALEATVALNRLAWRGLQVGDSARTTSSGGNDSQAQVLYCSTPRLSRDMGLLLPIQLALVTSLGCSKPSPSVRHQHRLTREARTVCRMMAMWSSTSSLSCARISHQQRASKQRGLRSCCRGRIAWSREPLRRERCPLVCLARVYRT